MTATHQREKAGDDPILALREYRKRPDMHEGSAFGIDNAWKLRRLFCLRASFTTLGPL